MIEVDPVDPVDLYRIFSSSKYAMSLSGKSRFAQSDLGMKPEWAKSAEWTNLLGPDVDNLWHLSHSIHVAQVYQLLDKDADATIPDAYPALMARFSNKYEVLECAAAIHDIQESTIGDLNYHEKTEETDRREREECIRIARELYFDRLSQEEIDEFAQIIFEKASPLGIEFNLIERIGYLMTAFRAADVYINSVFAAEVYRNNRLRDFEELQKGMQSIIRNTLPYQIKELMKLSSCSGVARRFLKNSAMDIERGLALIPDYQVILETTSLWNEFCSQEKIIPRYDTSSYISPSLTRSS